MLPVLCVSNNHRPYEREGSEIVGLGCPIAIMRHDKKGTCHRDRMYKMDELVCALGNHDASVVLPYTCEHGLFVSRPFSHMDVSSGAM